MSTTNVLSALTTDPNLLDAIPPLPVALAFAIGFLILSELLGTVEITTNRIIVNFMAVLPIYEIRFSDIVSMRLARGPFDDLWPGQRYGAALFSRRLIIKLSKHRWLSKTVHLKVRNARKILNAYNASAGRP